MRGLSQSSGGEGAGAHDLMNLPFDQIEGREAGSRVRIARGDALRLITGRRSDEIHAELAVGRRTREDDAARLVLLFHPDEVLVEADGPLVAGLHRAALREKPHGASSYAE